MTSICKKLHCGRDQPRLMLSGESRKSVSYRIGVTQTLASDQQRDQSFSCIRYGGAGMKSKL